MKYDLHIHSNISDGKLSREQILKIALNNDLKYMAFTEHNNFVPCQNYKKIIVLNGIEFDAFFECSFHVLCYFRNFNNQIEHLIQKHHENTNDRSETLIQKIRKIYNINIVMEELCNFFNKKYITKRDIIDWLIYNGYAQSVDEAANKFTNKNAKSYVQKYSIPFAEIVDVIKKDGYVILAHPNTITLPDEKLEEFIIKLKNLGLDGIEVVNPSKMNYNDTIIFKMIAEKNGLLTSGGSDFHSINNNIGIDGKDSDILIKKLVKN